MILLQIAALLLLYGEGQGRSLISHVAAPGVWRFDVHELVVFHTTSQSEDFPVKVSLMSYPDKKTTFSSALLSLTPDNHFQGAVKLVLKAEDSPGRFVYLVLESDTFRKEMRIPVNGGDWTSEDEPDSKRRLKRSLLSSHEASTMLSRYKRPPMQKCCLNGSDYYSREMDCSSGLQEQLQGANDRCRKAAEQCCIYTERHMYKEVLLSESLPTPQEEIMAITCLVQTPLNGTMADTEVDVRLRKFPSADEDQ